MADREYHKIYRHGGKTLCGFVAPAAEMPGVWSVYNRDRKKIAVIAPMNNAFNVMYYGADASASQEYVRAKTFDLAIARIFKTESVPTLVPPLGDIEMGIVPDSE